MARKKNNTRIASNTNHTKDTSYIDRAAVTVAKNQILDVPINKEYKDRVFKMLFLDKKNLLSLFNAINDTDYDNPDDIEINILENAIYMAMKNDVSFVLDVRMPFYEQQSSFNPNMPLRGLIYIAGALLKHVGNSALHRSVLVKIPVPQYVVFYNGSESAPERQVLKLSDAFVDSSIKGCVECQALLLNINAGKNAGLMEKCEPLYGYTTLVEKIRDFKSCGQDIKVAINAAIDWCIDQNILKEFLVSQREEVAAMFLSEYDEEEVRRLWAEDARAEGEKLGRLEGEKLGRLEGEKLGRLEGEKLGRLEGEKLGRLEGERLGIELARKIYKLVATGKTRVAIADELNISIDAVNDILAD